MAGLIHRVILRLSNPDYEALKVKAAEENLDISKYVRKLIQDALDEEDEF